MGKVNIKKSFKAESDFESLDIGDFFKRIEDNPRIYIKLYERSEDTKDSINAFGFESRKLTYIPKNEVVESIDVDLLWRLAN